MTSRLSSLLVQDGLVSAKRMADAFQRQVIYGGTLDTNLLEMRVVEEDVLLAYLGRASGLPTQPAGIRAWGRAEPEVLQVFTRELAERFRAVPGERIEGGVLRVLVSDPVEPQDMEALAQAVRCRIEPWIGPEFRVMEALEVVYGEPMVPRFQRLLNRSNQAHETKGLPPPRIIDPVPRFGSLLEFGLEVPGRVASPILEPEPSPPQRSEEPTPVDEAAVVEERPVSGECAQPSAAVLEPLRPAPPLQAMERGAEPVPELIPEQSAPLVPVKIAPPAEVPASPALDLLAAPHVAVTIPTASVPVFSPAPAAAPEPAEVPGLAAQQKTAPGPQPAAPGGKKKRRRRSEAPRVPPPAPIVAKPVITPPAREARPEPGRAAGEVLREPSVVVADLPAQVGAEPGVPQRLTAEHTPLPSPQPLSSDLSGPLGSFVSATQPAVAAEGGGRAVEPVPEPVDSGRLGEHLVRAPVRETHRVAVALGEPRPSPLSFEAAREIISGVEERDLIFETLCRAVRSRVSFAAVFTVHGDVAFGRTALGEGWLDRQGLGKVAVPLDRPSAFRIAVKGRSPHLGRIGDQPAAGEALAALGRRPPLWGAVLPVLVRGRTLALLYLDDGGQEFRPELLEELRPLMIDVSQAFQRLVLRSRAGGFTGTAEDGRRGQVESEMLTANTSSWRVSEREKRSRSTLTRFSSPGFAAETPKIIEVRDEPHSGGERAEAKGSEVMVPIPTDSRDQPTTRLRPGGARRSLPDPSPGPAARPEAVATPALFTELTPMEPARPTPEPERPPEPKRPPAETLPALSTLSELVGRAAAGDNRAVEQLLSEGEDGARSLVMALPGPLKSRERQALGDPIGEPVFARGPLLALVPRFGQAAVQPLLERLENPVTPPEVRYYIALCFTELPVEAAVRPLGHRLFDSDDAVRMAAVTALRSCPQGVELRDLLETLRSDLLGPDARRQQQAAEALGELRDVQAVPRLIQLLGHDDVLLANAAARALQTITKQDFGRSRWRWRMWWRRHQAEPRLQWMLAGLGHPSVAVRASAQDELRGLCGDVVGYRFDLPRREREAAQRRWVAWWQERGYPIYPP